MIVFSAHCNSFSEASSTGDQNSSSPSSKVISIKCTPDTSIQVEFHLGDKGNTCTWKGQGKNWNLTCMKSTACQAEVTCHKCDQIGSHQTICCIEANTWIMIKAGEHVEFTCTKKTSSQSNQAENTGWYYKKQH